MVEKRGMNYDESMKYVGVKRRTFDEKWRPRLIVMQEGTCRIFDRLDLDKLFDEFKAQAAAAAPLKKYSLATANSHNDSQYEETKVKKSWVKKQLVFTQAKSAIGTSINGITKTEFDKAALELMLRQKAG